MTQDTGNSRHGNSRDIDELVRQVQSASRHFELQAVRFVNCQFLYDESSENKDSKIRFGFPGVRVDRREGALESLLRFQFRAPSPFKEETSRHVLVSAVLMVRYRYRNRENLQAVTSEDADVFAKVNGIYNAWPYLREYVQSSLLRLGLPPFELPLLRSPAAAAQLAGLVKAAERSETTEHSD